MIKSIKVTNYLGESKKYELARPEKSGFAITHIDGLGPTKSSILTTEVATNDGAIFNSARSASRNVVITFDFRFAKNIEEARLESYKYFPNKKKLKLLIETDSRTCETYGYVESNEPDIFAKEETSKISILCPDPYLYSQAKNITVFSGIEPIFEFPFSNESLSENLLEISAIRNTTHQTVYYDGDAEIGMLIRIHVIGEAKNISIYNTATRETMKIDTAKLEALTGAPLSPSDTIFINTVKGEKYIRLLRGGVYYNILNCLNKHADWFQLSKGDNIFAYTAEEGINNLQFRIENQIVYEGV